MSIASSLKKYVPEPLRPCLRTLKRVVTRSKTRPLTYEDRVRAEPDFSQDILPLLVQRFHFDVFAAFGNIVDVFIDRTYGPNFDPEKAWDWQFIDSAHTLDVQEIDAGRVKPTHMYAVMTQTPTQTPLSNPRFPRHWSPEFCVRHP